jgi:hypothetical protein
VTSPAELPWNDYLTAIRLPTAPPAPEPEPELPEPPVFLDYGRDI